MVKRLNSTNEGWQGNEYHYTGRDKINYIARTNSLGNWEYRAANGPSTWKAMPKGYQTVGGFKFDNNSAWNRRTNENSYTSQANENIRKFSKNADQLTKARQRANRNVRVPFVNNTAELQNALWYAGAFDGLKDRHGRDVTYETATDGIRGNITNQAIQNAVNMGYNVDINRGTLVKADPVVERKSSKVSIPKTSVTTSIFGPISKILNFEEEKPGEKIQTLTEDAARQRYQNGAGDLDIYSAGLYHALAPESWSMPHSSKLKDQIAAEIAYTEGLPQSQRERDPYNIEGQTYIGYGTHGKLSEQLGNVNDQTNENNATSKVMGGYRYIVNPDNSVDVIDPYSFNIVRDFTRTNKDGKPYVYKGQDVDPYAGHEWKGLYHDIVTEGNGKSVQNIMENFFSRQRKKRKNNIHFEPGEINRRNKDF